MVCPSAWWWHLFQACGYNKRTAHSVLDYFEMDAAYVADESTFDRETGTVTTQFANMDNFLDCMENELGSEDEDDASVDCSVGGTPKSCTSIEISEDAKASLASALSNPDMDLAANSHASAKSCCTNFSSSTGNSTNHFITTKKFAMNHKARAIELAQEKKRASQLEHKNRKMAQKLQALELLYMMGNVRPLKTGVSSTTAALAGSLSSPIPQARFDDSARGNAAFEVQGTSPNNAPDDAMEGDDKDHKMEEVDDKDHLSPAFQ